GRPLSFCPQHARLPIQFPMVNPAHESNSPDRKVLLADWIVGPGGQVLGAGGVALVGGAIGRVFDSHGEAKRWAMRNGSSVETLESGVLGPGWINAHCHLELTELAGKISPEGGFPGWIAGLMGAKRAMDLQDYRRGVQAGAERLLAGGTTFVGDIDSQGVGGGVECAIQMLVYREALDAFHPGRAVAALASVESPLELGEGRFEGLAPHASFTVSPELMVGMARQAKERGLPLTVHWSETQAEVEWLRSGEGPLAKVLGRSPGCSGLDILESAGLLSSHVSLVHGNWPEPGEPQRISRAGACLVHCPGSHEFFGREPFPMDSYLEAGVCVALGTDSQASNSDLDMGREIALLRNSFPGLGAELAFTMGTEHGARALGWSEQVGRIEPGLRADLVHFEGQGMAQGDVLERLTTENLPAAGVWVEGRRVH
ncbi:MAG: amidohydrolase family protein, partial [Planctomycetota bacterium]|nr:amidohydrolase family protein [Planctomycetota bacterium]